MAYWFVTRYVSKSQQHNLSTVLVHRYPVCLYGSSKLADYGVTGVLQIEDDLHAVKDPASLRNCQGAN